MPYSSISKAKQASFEAMHCLTIALLHILSVTVDKRRGSNYKEEIRLFSALCRWQMETGGRLFLMISLEEEQKQMYERHFLEMKTVTERTKKFISDSPREFRAHPITKRAVRQLQEWNTETAEPAVRWVRPVIITMNGTPERPWFNQQLQHRER
ncbi:MULTISPECIES: hypothetical protein [Bacillus]|uniref:DUF3800 domain-containing protein n=1 Tax=Bacillus velezensis TaxID=492670 RepID=A0ABC8D3M0_BACVE|nr:MULTISPECIES: hypothetical protein [Bacillus]AJC24245.1 hypothetical protein SB24_03210 [Bacillus sp. Pc3]AMQ70807.1 hypothetical protein BAMY6639_18200 [Bacillus amyloliquefaciens UMAF6639]AMR50012.1 hypothetical protein A1R12_06500 [Bacillus amyloliquefaciens]ANB46259.1 hypothetical protein A1D33_002760 [Bacillus velezensis]AVI28103.1 hypothetical protein C3Z10_06870 [Bacillus velezensis]